MHFFLCSVQEAQWDAFIACRHVTPILKRRVPDKAIALYSINSNIKIIWIYPRPETSNGYFMHVLMLQ